MTDRLAQFTRAATAGVRLYGPWLFAADLLSRPEEAASHDLSLLVGLMGLLGVLYALHARAGWRNPVSVIRCLEHERARAEAPFRRRFGRPLLAFAAVALIPALVLGLFDGPDLAYLGGLLCAAFGQHWACLSVAARLSGTLLTEITDASLLAVEREREAHA